MGSQTIELFGLFWTSSSWKYQISMPWRGNIYKRCTKCISWKQHLESNEPCKGDIIWINPSAVWYRPFRTRLHSWLPLSKGFTLCWRLTSFQDFSFLNNLVPSGHPVNGNNKSVSPERAPPIRDVQSASHANSIVNRLSPERAISFDYRLRIFRYRPFRTS